MFLWEYNQYRRVKKHQECARIVCTLYVLFTYEDDYVLPVRVGYIRIAHAIVPCKKALSEKHTWGLLLPFFCLCQFSWTSRRVQRNHESFHWYEFSILVVRWKNVNLHYSCNLNLRNCGGILPSNIRHAKNVSVSFL